MSSSSSTESPKAGDHVSEPINEELRYMYASNVNVSNFVSVKLLDKSNYIIWKKQMLCLLDSHNLRGFVDSKYELPEVKSSNIMKQYNSLVEGWIYGLLNEYMLKVLVDIEGPRYIWSALETICDPQEAPTAGSSSPKAGDHHVSDRTVDPPEIKSPNIETQYRSLVKGWILRSLNEDMHREVSWFDNPRSIWKILEGLYGPKEDSTHALNNFHHRIVKRSTSLFNAPGVLYAWADSILWATRSFKEAMWLLQETVLILLVPVAILYPLYQLIRLLILVILYPFFMLYFLLWTVLAIAVKPIKRIEKKRKKFQEAKEFVNIIGNHIDNLGPFDDDDGHPCYSKPFLEAVCQGAFEVVDEILSRSPHLILIPSKEGHSFIELAITNRSEKIYNLIYHLNIKMDRYKEIVDSSENNILHLAGRLAPERILSRTTGAALQLQRELQWFQEVEKLMLPEDLLKKNDDKETPQMVFTREHADLVKEGEQWMKDTSEANSITAALIMTIVFAAAITVPGGNNQEKGIPLFKNEIAFTIFAVCDAISLFSAATALLMSISIRRFAEIDFLVSIPRRLIIGLCALFLSTASMMVAFSAIFFLVFCDQRPWMLAPIGGLACTPIAVIVTVQLPFLVDLLKSTYIPIFGKQKYIARGKFISNHPTLLYGKY